MVSIVGIVKAMCNDFYGNAVTTVDIPTNYIPSANVLGNVSVASVRVSKMARSTAPILAVGAITITNKSLLAKEQQPIDFHVVLATGVAAIGLGLLEKVSEGLAVGLAWVALVAVLFADLDKKAGAPAENLLRIMGAEK
jgi:hypothetical protein